jgi:hypothetical protein
MRMHEVHAFNVEVSRFIPTAIGQVMKSGKLKLYKTLIQEIVTLGLNLNEILKSNEVDMRE